MSTWRRGAIACSPPRTNQLWHASSAQRGQRAVTFVAITSPPSDAIGTAQTLIANGCENQLDVLVEASPSATDARQR